jgi:hypothetical protein
MRALLFTPPKPSRSAHTLAIGRNFFGGGVGPASFSLSFQSTCTQDVFDEIEYGSSHTHVTSSAVDTKIGANFMLAARAPEGLDL